MYIPTTANAFTDVWLTDVLRRSNTITQAAVTSCKVQPLGENNDFTSQQVRLVLTYDRPEVSAPHSLIAKFSAADPQMQTYQKSSYEREVHFYQQVASKVTLRTPHCYYSAFDPEIGTHVLLLEDLAPATSPAWEEGCTQTQIEEAIRQIAKVHADWWDSPQLTEKGIGQPDQAYLRQRQERYQTQAWDAFLTKVGDQMPAAVRDLGKSLGEYFVKVFTYLQQPPVTLTHFDYKPSNFFFDIDQDGVLSLTVVNWQLHMRHRGVFDIAYLLSGGIKSEVRQQKEQAWLALYHATLCEHGVLTYSLDQCRFDYRLSLLRRFMRFVIVVGNRGFNQEQQALFYRILLPRTCSALLDFDARTVLAELDELVDSNGVPQTTVTIKT